MPEEVHSPLLSLIKERSLIDDLQYEEVSDEFKRSGKPVIQILQDFGIMDLDSILQAMADHLGTEVVPFREMDLSPQVIQSVPPNTARMYECLPLNLDNGTLKLALVDPLNPSRIDELGFLIKKDLKVVVADPVAIKKEIEKFYLDNGTLKLALVDPLNPSRIDELGFLIKKDLKVVVADPVAITKAIEKFYPQDHESVSDILKELGED